MAYEKVKLVIAGLSGDIFLARLNKNGTMSDNRRKVTSEAQIAVAEWFIANKKDTLEFEGFGKLKWIPEKDDDR